MKMTRIPLQRMTEAEREVSRSLVNSEEWTFTLAHYEEAFPRLEWLKRAYPAYGPVIVHRHAHSVTFEQGGATDGQEPELIPCNDQCVFVGWT